MLQSSYRLRIEVQMKSTLKWYSIEYSSFAVSSGSTKYKLTVSEWAGESELGDLLMSTNSKSAIGANNMAFTTYDNDNDNCQLLLGSTLLCLLANCAGFLDGGWWFNARSTDDSSAQ